MADQGGSGCCGGSGCWVQVDWLVVPSFQTSTSQLKPLCSLSTNAQNPMSANLSLHFQPSFHQWGRLELTQDNSLTLVSLRVSSNAQHPNIEADLEFNNAVFSKFWEVLKTELSNLRQHEDGFGCDGMSIEFDYSSGDNNLSRSFWSPDDGTAPQVVMCTLLDILIDRIDDGASRRFMETVYGYLYSKPQIREQISDAGTTIRISGGISSGMEDDLQKFFQRVSAASNLTIDMRNFDYMGTLLYAVFRRFLGEAPHAKWLVNLCAYQQLAEIGIPNEQITIEKPSNHLNDNKALSMMEIVGMSMKAYNVDYKRIAQLSGLPEENLKYAHFADQLNFSTGFPPDTLPKVAAILRLRKHALEGYESYTPEVALPESLHRIALPSDRSSARNSYVFELGEQLILIDPSPRFTAYIWKQTHERFGKQPTEVWVTNTYDNACIPNAPWKKAKWFGNSKAKQKLTWPDDSTFKAIQLPKHCKLSFAYLYEYTDTPICFVGGSLVAGGMLPRNDFHGSKQEIAEKLLTLPPHTIICPSLGPPTTVAQELANNPFFARKS